MPHDVPQPPQLFGSVCSFTHTPLQTLSPVGHTHVPLRQVPPSGQAVPQAPQLLPSVSLLTQVLAHTVSPAGQTQVPLWQLPPAGHVVPQAPQLLSSVSSFAQTFPHATSPLGQTQVPPVGVAPEDHIEIWLIDIDHANNDPATVFRDAAKAVQALRNEGKTVFVHCVNAETRTPLVAAAYGALHTGATAAEAVDRVRGVLPTAGQRTQDLWVALESMSFGDSA